MFISVNTCVNVNIRAHRIVPQNNVLSQFNPNERRIYRGENRVETFIRLLIGTTKTNSVL